MKRKRTDHVVEDPHKRDDFYNKDELLTWSTSLQLEFNREFQLPYNDLSILRLVQAQTQIEQIAKINLVMQACITEGIFKTVDEIREMISINT